MKLSTIRPALTGAAAAAVAAGITAAPGGSTDAEIGAIAGAAIVAGLGVWRMPNADPPEPRR